jgi:hypothetical protein
VLGYAGGNRAAAATAGHSRQINTVLDVRSYWYGGGDNERPQGLLQTVVTVVEAALAVLHKLPVERMHSADVPLHRDGGDSGRGSIGRSGARAVGAVAEESVICCSVSRKDVLHRYASWVECACATRGASYALLLRQQRRRDSLPGLRFFLPLSFAAFPLFGLLIIATVSCTRANILIFE